MLVSSDTPHPSGSIPPINLAQVTRAIVGEALGEPDPLQVDIPTASVSVIDYPDGFSADAFAAGDCKPPLVQAVGTKPVLEE